MYKKEYHSHNKYVGSFFGDDFSTERLEQFRRHLLQRVSPGTARVRWATAVYWYRKNNDKESEEALYCKPIWIAHTIPFREHKKDTTRRLNDCEFNKLLSVSSERDTIMFSTIRRMDLKIGQLINLTILSPNVPDDVRRDASRLFDGKKWLFETQGGKKRRRTYIGTRINELSKKALGFIASCESLRPEKFTAGKARLDEYGATI